MNNLPSGAARRKPIQHEGNEQEALFDWAANLRRQGVKSGVPDLCLPVARGGYHGLYIEMKYGKNKTSENQNKWLEALRAQNYAAAVCYGWQEAQQVITNYLERRNTTERKI